MLKWNSVFTTSLNVGVNLTSLLECLYWSRRARRNGRLGKIFLSGHLRVELLFLKILFHLWTSVGNNLWFLLIYLDFENLFQPLIIFSKIKINSVEHGVLKISVTLLLESLKQTVELEISAGGYSRPKIEQIFDHVFLLIETTAMSKIQFILWNVKNICYPINWSQVI